MFEVPGGQGRTLVQKYERKARRTILAWMATQWIVFLGAVGFGFYVWYVMDESILVFAFFLLIALLFYYFASQKTPKSDFLVPKLLISHGKDAERAPYVDGTGSHAGALLGDVRHDPYQSGGLETPSHVRVESGAIHRANEGVLFIDEINVLRLESQQALLTAMQERQYAIVGQSQSSSGAMIRTDPVPCDFILVAAGNLDAVSPPEPGHPTGMHPALRSRIRGYGYEVYVNSIMDDTAENRHKLVQFVAQEVVRDGKIPHFDRAAVAEIVREAQRRAGETGKLTLRLRELGGLIRTAGDIAREDAVTTVTREHVRRAKDISRSLEQQITANDIERHRAREAQDARLEIVGTAKGLALVGTGDVGEPAGLIVPVEAAVVPALSRSGGNIVVGHGLKERAGSAVENVGALLKVLKGSSIADYDVHVDALLHHNDAETEGVGVAVAVAAISALENLPVRQDRVMTGTLAVNGDLRPVRGLVQRIEAAVQIGYKAVIVPEAARDDVLLDPEIGERIEIVYARNLADVLGHMLTGSAGSVAPLALRLRAHNGHRPTNARAGEVWRRQRAKPSLS